LIPNCEDPEDGSKCPQRNLANAFYLLGFNHKRLRFWNRHLFRVQLNVKVLIHCEFRRAKIAAVMAYVMAAFIKFFYCLLGKYKYIVLDKKYGRSVYG
jgi:hypothetical protein